MKATAAANVMTLQQLLAKSSEAGAKVDEAGEFAKDDQQVAAAIASWKALIDAKTTLLAAASKDLTAKTAAEQAAVQQLAAKQQVVAAALAAQGITEKKVAALTAALVPLQERTQQAKQAAETAAAAIAEAQAQLSDVTKTIAVAQGLEPAA